MSGYPHSCAGSPSLREGAGWHIPHLPQEVTGGVMGWGGRKPYKQMTAIPGRWWQVILEPHYPIHCVFCTKQAQSRGGDWENLMEEVRFELSLSGWIRQAPCRVCQRWSLFVDNSDTRLTFTQILFQVSLWAEGFPRVISVKPQNHRLRYRKLAPLFIQRETRL